MIFIKILFIVGSYLVGVYFYFLHKRSTNSLFKKVNIIYALLFFLASGTLIGFTLINHQDKIVHVASSIRFSTGQMSKYDAAISTVELDDITYKDEIKLTAPLIEQMPELPRGCEVTALGMLLAYNDIHVDKLTLAKEVKRNPAKHKIENGKIYFGNPYNGFIGDMYSFDQPGLGVYHKPIADLAKQYAGDLYVEDFSGEEFNKIIHHLNLNRPVWVIINSHYKHLPDSEFVMWETEDGPMKITYREHSVLITGYDENYIYFNDPLNYRDRAEKKNFIKSWEQMGKQAITMY